MKTYDIIRHDGRLFACEVNNTLLGRRAACEIARRILGAQVVRQPQQWFSWWREDVFCECLLGAARFEIWEPFGDSSRYWIGPAGDDPADMRPTEGIALMREAFARAGATWFSARTG